MAIMDIREQLVAFMAATRWNQADVARASGLPQPTIQRILSGVSKEPRRATVDRLLRVIGRTLDLPGVMPLKDGVEYVAPPLGPMNPYNPSTTRVKHIDNVLDAETLDLDQGRTLIGPMTLRTRWLEAMFPATDVTNLAWGHPGSSVSEGNITLAPDDLLLIDCGQCDPAAKSGIYAVEMPAGNTQRNSVAYFGFTALPGGHLTMSMPFGQNTPVDVKAMEFCTVGRVIYIWRGAAV